MLRTALAAGSLLALVSFATTPAPAVAPLAAGPPAICFPIDIGEAASLPWDSGRRSAMDDAYDLARLARDTRGILEGSDDTLVHMETLRRAVVYVAESPAESSAKRTARCEELFSMLRRRVVQVEIDAARDASVTDAVRGLVWFDLGYAQGALEQVGFGDEDRGDGALWQAARLRGDDGAVHLGAALALWRGGSRGELSREHLASAIELATEDHVLLRRNLVQTAGTFLGKHTYDELAAEVRRQVEKG